MNCLVSYKGLNGSLRKRRMGQLVFGAWSASRSGVRTETKANAHSREEDRCLVEVASDPSLFELE